MTQNRILTILAAGAFALLLSCLQPTEPHGDASAGTGNSEAITDPYNGGAANPGNGGATADLGSKSSADPDYDDVITNLPNRPLTPAELNAWIARYNATGGPSEFELEVVRLINAERAAAGVAALTIGTPLMMASRFKSQNMADLGYFSHTSPIYATNPNDYSPGIIAQMFGGPRTPSENIARATNTTPAAIVNMWMNSEGHRNNILSASSRSIGAGAHSIVTVSGNRTTTNTFVTTNFSREEYLSVREPILQTY